MSLVEGGTRLDAGPLLSALPDSQEEASQIRDRALAQPELLRTLVSPDAQSSAIYLSFLPEFMEARDPLVVSQQVEEVIRDFHDSFATLFQLGAPYQTHSQYTALMQDACLILPLSFALIFGLLVTMMGSWHAGLLPLLTSAVSILWTLGFMGFVGIPGTNVNFILPSLLMIVGSTEDIHIFAGYLEGHARNLSPETALHYMASKTGTAILLTATTTFLGFLSLSLSPLVIIREFGVAAAFGLFVNPLITIILAPWYLRRFVSGPGLLRTPSFQMQFDKLAEGLLRLAVKDRPRAFVAVITVFCLTTLPALTVRFENDPLGFFREGAPLIGRVAEVREQLSGPDELVLHLAGVPGALGNIETWRRLDEFQGYVEQLEWTGRTLSILDPLKWMNRQVLGGGHEFYSLPSSIGSIQEYLVLLALLPQGDYLSLDQDALLFRIRHSLSSSSALMSAVAALERDAKGMLGPDLRLRVTGESLLIHGAVLGVVTSHWWSLLAAGAVIFLVLGGFFRDLSLSLAALVANLFPLSTNFCLMRLFEIPLDLATSMIGVIAIGVSVDHSIHLVSRYQQEIRRDGDPRAALLAVLRAELLPILTSSIALASGFAVLGFSRFLPVAHLGILGSTVMLSAMVANLLIIPLWLSGRAGSARPVPGQLEGGRHA